MANGYADALMLDYRGYVAEATGANVFFIKGDEIHTPTPDCFLNGITRQTVIELAKERGYKVIERHIMPEELANFDECFLTGTAAEVTPVSLIGEYSFKPGKACETLINAYHRSGDAEEGRGRVKRRLRIFEGPAAMRAFLFGQWVDFPSPRPSPQRGEGEEWQGRSAPLSPLGRGAGEGSGAGRYCRARPSG